MLSALRSTNVLSVIGTRPELVQAAPVSEALRGRCREILVHTGQHYDDELSKVFLDELRLPVVDHYLGVGSGTHAEQTARVMLGIERILTETPVDLVLVRGDTNSGFAATLAAAKLGFPIAHAEAGTRCFDRSVPEEVNRVVMDHLSDLDFCPTERALRNLSREGILRGAHLTGDVTVDSIRRVEEDVRQRAPEILERLGLRHGAYVVATIHRPSNSDVRERLAGIVAALSKLDGPVVFPAHPRTASALERLGISPGRQVRLVPPQPYVAMLALLSHARCCVTDSGGIQKETYLLGTPCITVRDVTEWPETVEAGWNVLVPADPDRIVSAVSGMHPPSARPAFFGEGRAAEQMVEILMEA